MEGYKVKRFSKLYEKSKAEWDRKDDYEIAEIAKENSKLKGKVIGAGLGLGAGLLANKGIRKLISKNPKNIVGKLNKVAPDLLESIPSNLTAISTSVAGSHYGGELTGNISKRKILKEIEKNRELKNKTK